MEKICVAVRVRPSKSDESSGGSYWKVEDNRISLHKAHGDPIAGASYAFDHVFDESSTNDRVYELLAKEIVHSSVDGFNATWVPSSLMLIEIYAEYQSEEFYKGNKVAHVLPIIKLDFPHQLATMLVLWVHRSRVEKAMLLIMLTEKVLVPKFGVTKECGLLGTVFAYGQTSSGKTFTMNGSQEERGIIQQAVKDIFEKIQMVSSREFLIRVSYMEIYNEEIHDLFTVENQKLQIHESLENGIFVAGLKEEIVNNPEQVLKLIESGEVNRHLGETNMNAHSSRSHTLFRMVIESKGKDNSSLSDCSSTDAVRVSVLNLVDLAGSERIAKTGADGVRLKEGRHINKSLMVLGNVINKLSDGAKRRGHIPYRDSKLTRILQPALGGNAKTSIICTLAPEELHVEETKGTLQFASRAKSVTNCVQVNEILTDAALLKRQKLEIEKLRKKLEGSHTEVLEQEVLKLRNEMLTNELEREKLAMELEEERKSHRERVQCKKEEPMKMENLSSLVPSDSDRNFNETREIFHEEGIAGNSTCQGDIFGTPTFKEAPNAFVFKRSHYSRLPDCSPLPYAFSTVADEDTWLKMNKGYVANLDSLQMTPAVKAKSLLSSDPAPVYLNQTHEIEERQNLKRELELAIAEKNELEKKHMEQIVQNSQLVREISELRKEALLIQEVPRRLCKSVATCRDIYEDVVSTIQTSIPDGKAATAEIIYGAREIGAIIFSTLESHFSVAIDGDSSFTGNKPLIQEQRKVLLEKLTGTLTSLGLTDTPTDEKKQPNTPICSCDHKVAWSQLARNHLSIIIVLLILLFGYIISFFRILILP